MRFSEFADQAVTRVSSFLPPNIVVGSLAARPLVTFMGGVLAICFALIVFSPLLLIWPDLAVTYGPALAGSFALLLASLAIASKTGDLRVPRLMAAATLFAATLYMVGNTGGLASPVLPLVTVPILVAISWNDKTISAVLTILTIAALGFKYMTSHGQLAGQGDVGALAQLTTMIVLLVGVGLVGTIIMRNRTELAEAVRSATHQRNLIAENVSELVTRHESGGGTLFVSPAARPLFGVSPLDLMGAGFLERVHLQDRIKFLKALSDAEHNGRPAVCELRLRYKTQSSSRWKWAMVSVRSQRDETTGRVDLIAVSKDITDAKEQAEDLQAALAEARNDGHAQKHFLATMSHELRTPLNAIIGFSDFLQQDSVGEISAVKRAEYIGHIRQSGHHLLNVVNDLINVSRLESGRYEMQPQQFGLVEIVDATLDMLHPIAQKNGVDIACDVAANLPEITADRRACQQVMINVVSNAIKFTPSGGHVRVSARQYGRNLKIKIKDTGCGIPAEFLSRMGQPFAQANVGLNRNHEGSGLGLYVVKGLVDLHGGEIDIKSTQGSGTTVTILLPLKCAAPKPVPASSEDGLVKLSDVAVRKNEQEIKTSQTFVGNQGESRARVSA